MGASELPAGVRLHELNALHDLRPESPTAGMASLVELGGARLAGMVIPHGVAHGFYFNERSTQILAVSHYWDTADELACHWADPRLEIPWPCRDPALSARDAAAGSLAQMVEQLHAA